MIVRESVFKPKESTEELERAKELFIQNLKTISEIGSKEIDDINIHWDEFTDEQRKIIRNIITKKSSNQKKNYLSHIMSILETNPEIEDLKFIYEPNWGLSFTFNYDGEKLITGEILDHKRFINLHSFEHLDQYIGPTIEFTEGWKAGQNTEDSYQVSDPS